MNDPLRELFPVYERDHAPPAEPRRCPRCARTMDFTHYDAERVALGEFASYRFYVVQLVVLVALSLICATAGFYLGLAGGVVAAVLAAPALYYWMKTRIAARAVWRCTPCDGYFVGPRLHAWKAP